MIKLDDRPDTEPLTEAELNEAAEAAAIMESVLTTFVDQLRNAKTVGDLRASEKTLDGLDKL